ncbi:MAG: site-2 protease family protein [Clostridia bacterium]|nr:site-2 protease family protein [Clostridia bacterium]
MSIPGLLIAITFHEFAHAWVADKLGDDTPRNQGRLSLNPLAHLDPFGAILMLFAGFGWGKPVTINPSNFNRKVSIKKGNALVSLAGPAMNFILALLFSVIFGLIYKFADGFILSSVGKVVMIALQYTIFMNVGLGVFNLIPLPPLDGAKILLGVLPDNAVRWYKLHESFLYIVFLVIWITPIASYMIAPIISFIDAKLLQLIIMIAVGL